MYALGNPVLYTDPSGHCFAGVDTVVCAAAGAVVGMASYSFMLQLAQTGACGCDLQRIAMI
jgi:hypothetical protein